MHLGVVSILLMVVVEAVYLSSFLSASSPLHRKGAPPSSVSVAKRSLSSVSSSSLGVASQNSDTSAK